MDIHYSFRKIIAVVTGGNTYLTIWSFKCYPSCTGREGAKEDKGTTAHARIGSVAVFSHAISDSFKYGARTSRHFEW